jgi:hypothetical protein
MRSVILGNLRGQPLLVEKSTMPLRISTTSIGDLRLAINIFLGHIYYRMVDA